MKLTVTQDHTTLDFTSATNRKCAACSLCCKLLPTSSLNKASNTRCKYQRQNAKGCCTIYQNRPPDCQMWSCRWLADPGTAGMPRPDRCHYVLDPLPDMIRITNNQTGATQEQQALQVWVDPAHREAAHAPELRAYMAKIAQTLGWPTIVRFSSREGYVSFPPAITRDAQWHDHRSRSNDNFGSFARLKALGLEAARVTDPEPLTQVD